MSHTLVVPELFQTQRLLSLQQCLRKTLMLLFMLPLFICPAWGQISSGMEKDSARSSENASSNEDASSNSAKTVGCRPLPPAGPNENGFSLSRFNERLPLGHLAQEVAAHVAGSQDPFSTFRGLPPGLQPLVYLHLPQSTRESIVQRMFAGFLREHGGKPGASTAISKTYRVYKNLLPQVDQARQRGYFSTSIGRNFIGQLTEALTPSEMRFVNTTIAREFHSTLSTNFPDGYMLSLAGYNFLKENAALFPTAGNIIRVIEENPDYLEKMNQDAKRPSRYEDGFLFVPEDFMKDDPVRTAGCVCYTGWNCGKWGGSCGSHNCVSHGYRQCGYFWSWVECTALC